MFKQVRETGRIHPRQFVSNSELVGSSYGQKGSNVGFCKIIVEKDTDKIIGATIVAERAGEIINEVSLAMKYNLGLFKVGRNIHSYPTTGEAVQGCGLQYINKHWTRFDQSESE